ncbi:MAG: efflux RND transporter permease subunit [Gammaproteobacteria bacterium]|nr:efflux RND transporter permease subunit [Gammaproteobacteria bacterium]MBT8110335.1 efflux RND transporter permease subunit [Gammaproteobacteria bacterium]NND47682.1 efflux RND transporter permease subunit [Woeseiaceae bacterium]NNL45038.1 efflux RND transporter permease subunit [Woeseiaceae bacterium]
MNSSERNDLPSISVRRPVLVLVVNLLIVIAGIAALLAVEIRELPDVDRPVVTVRAVFPGASPETMDTEVVSLLEGAVARVSGIQNLRSASEENSGRIYIEFRPGVDLDTAAADVREAVSRVSRRLPERLEQVVVVKADDDAQSIASLAVSSDALSMEALTHVVEQELVPMFISIEGVADVQISGARQRMLRVAIDPLRLTSYGLSINEVAAALMQAPFDVPAGSFRSLDQELIVRADATVVDAAEIAEIVIRGSVRIGDVANVFFGPEDTESLTRLDGRPVLGLGIVRQARSNTIEISEEVNAAVERINDRFTDLEVVVTDDQAIFISSAVTQVLITLALSISIVIATIWLFMGSFRATLVPVMAIPVALIGTVAAIWLLGFSINILTLLALVLATGLVVDDAIVVLENVQRQRADGMRSRAAAVIGTRQVFFAVIATTAVLISVFIPIAFLPSTAGRLFREFGLVLASAVIISSFVALSLVPAAAARLVKGADATRVFKPLAYFGRGFAGMYKRSLAALLARPWIPVAGALVFAAAAAVVYQTLDRELVPPEDRGLVRVFASGPDGVGINYMDRQTEKIEAILQHYVDRGEAISIYSMIGKWDPNRTLVSMPLVDWGDRARNQQEILDELRAPLAAIPGVRASAWSDNSLNLRGSGGGLSVALLGNNYDEIFEAAKKFTVAIEDRLPNLTRPRISFDPTQPQLSVEIDRRRAADLGVDLPSLAATLRAMIDGDELIDLNIDDEAVPILLESASGEINDPSDLVNLYVSASNGELIPLSSIVSLKEEGVATELNRYAQRRAIEINIERSESYALQTAVDELRSVANDVLPADVSLVFRGEAATLEETSREVAITYIIAVAVIFLVLAAQFEGFTSALVVTLIVPFGVAAAIFALLLTGTSLNIYSQIGLVLLIGLMAKNSVLVVEFADQLRDKGLGVREAIEQGAARRLRPVMMTLVSTVLGGLPLILGTGAGAEARHAIGWVVFGGLGISALFTLYLTPALYLLVAGASKARVAETERLAEELEHANAQMRG